jgi:hypothetical protein
MILIILIGSIYLLHYLILNLLVNFYTHLVFFYFIQAGIILLLAMIGAIVLTMQKGQAIRRQHISEQLSRQIVNSFFVIQKKINEKPTSKFKIPKVL